MLPTANTEAGWDFLGQILCQFCNQSEAWKKSRVSKTHMLESEKNFNFLSNEGCALTQLFPFHRFTKTKLLQSSLHHRCEHTQQIWESCHCLNPVSQPSYLKITLYCDSFGTHACFKYIQLHTDVFKYIKLCCDLK